jgi:hypothetical protein
MLAFIKSESSNRNLKEVDVMGLVVFAVIGLYLLISIAVVRWAIRYARKHRKDVRYWGWGAALMLYLIPFWDWIPTVATHQYHCATEAGFWVYKTPEQWKKENPGVLETLVANDPSPTISKGDIVNYVDTYIWNKRFNSVVKKSGPLFLNIWRHEQDIVDVDTGEILGRRVDFSTGNGNVGGEPEMRFWMHSDYCFGGHDNAINFVRIFKQFKGTGK